jgi:hypothetical protein
MKRLSKITGALVGLLTMLAPLSSEAQFMGSTQPQTFFPAAGGPFPIPTSTVSRPTWPTFYNQRNNGSCYNAEIDINGDGVQERIYVWAINWEDVAGYSNAIAYEIKDPSDNILHRGTKYIGADVANLNVGLYVTNGRSLHVAVAYYAAASTPSGGSGIIKLADFAFSPASGLSLFTSTDLYYMRNRTYEAQHIGIDCHDSTALAVVWEDAGYGVFIEGFERAPGGGLIRSFPQQVGGIGGRIPDVALSHNTSTGKREAHVVFNNVSVPRIEKYTVDFDLLVGGSWPVPVLENTEPCSVFGPYWDDFNIKIDAPDHHTGTRSDWAYTFFDNDANKIKVKVCNAGTYNSYVVNNGTISAGGPGGPFLWNITNAGNAFPTITYHPSGEAMYVGWYTNYNAGMPPGAPNNPLYDYTGTPMGYVSVVLDKAGFFRSPAYNRVDNDFMTNRIGKFIDPANPWTDYNYPKICFSKHNEGPKLFTLFSSHNMKSNIVYAPGCPGSSLQTTYHESVGSTYSCTSTLITNGTSYATALPGFISTPTTTVYLSQKYSSWTTLAPVVRMAQDEPAAAKVELASNPFSSNELFQLTGGDGTMVYQAVLTGMDGKRITEYSGTIAGLNKSFQNPLIRNLPAGVYLLQLRSSAAVQDFRLLKQ